ncbi:MAG TPA: glycosyltransferase, partial [Baekduia sp.]|nr:glycosyltransferase [Baekduia sp.]
GVPVVTTTVGAEGMDLVDGEHAMIADGDAELAAAIARVHTDPELWARLSAAGPVHIDRTLGIGAATAALDEILATMLPRPFVVTDAWSSPETLPTVLRAYLDAFTAADDVSLVLPTTGDPEAAIGRALEVLGELGADPEAIPDVAILPAAERVPVPRSGVRVGAAPWREEPVVTIAAAAPATAWRDAPAEAPEPQGPLVSIVICLYGKRAYTERCLASLEDALGPKLGRDVELVLVDNNSPDDTAALLDAWEDRATVLRLPENRNFAGGNNAGAEAARGRVLLFLNNDTEVPAGVVEELATEALRPSVGIAGLRLVYPDGRLQHGGYGWRGTQMRCAPFHFLHGEDSTLPGARSVFDTTGLTGACIAIRADFFDELGGFDEDFVNGWEDTDLCQKARAAGARLRYRGDLRVLHHEGVTSGRDYRSADNEARFRERWQLSLDGDAPRLMAQLGLVLGGELADAPRGRPSPDGADLVVVGPVKTSGPLAEEARAMVVALDTAGADVAARTPVPGWMGPVVDDDERAVVLSALARDAQPGARTIVVRDGSLASPEAPIGGGPADPSVVAAGSAPSVLRLADVPETIAEDAIAWAATPALAARLAEAGWPAERIFVVPPQGVGADLGRGGGGTIVLLADHDDGVASALLAALATGRPDGDVVLLPTARTSELAERVRAAAPGLRLTSPLTDADHFGRLAGHADLVV